jgi:hypothetical protein
VLGLGEEFVVVDLERLVGGLSETPLQVVFDHHGTGVVNFRHVKASSALHLSHTVSFLVFLFFLIIR